jgi:hypothetical protein
MRKRCTLEKIVKDILEAAAELGTFNIRQLAERSGHPWVTTNKIVRLFLLKDTLRMAFAPTGTPRHYKVTSFSITIRPLDKIHIREVLRRVEL